MENIYNPACSSSLSPPPPEPPDDISLFLHQILLRSSSSASPYSLVAHNGTPKQSISPLLSGSELRISAVEASSGAVFSSSGGYFAPTAPNLCSSSVGTIDNDPDEYDCESEEGFEALVGEVPEKPVPLRNNSSKRGRAAEVHNMSEKRRRCRINEKMKALQNLIPNSNKTDKASMLDEAIEYLKQLQLQVQMLTMRNGLSLYPMCLPGALQQAQFPQMKMDFCEGNGLLNMNATGILPVNQEITTNNFSNDPNQSTSHSQPFVAALSSIINSETSFGREQLVQSHLRPFMLHTSSKEIRREDMLPRPQLDVDHSETKSLGQCGVVSIPCDTKEASDVKDNVVESCMPMPESVILSNLGTRTGRSPTKGGIRSLKGSF